MRYVLLSKTEPMKVDDSVKTAFSCDHCRHITTYKTKRKVGKCRKCKKPVGIQVPIYDTPDSYTYSFRHCEHCNEVTRFFFPPDITLEAVCTKCCMPAPYFVL